MQENKEVSGNQAIAYRNYRRARDRALTRLSHLYADEYKQLLVEERENDEQEGKKWVSAGDSTRITITTQSRESAIPAVAGRTDYESPDESYDGGEA
jgi:hypothetical protein